MNKRKLIALLGAGILSLTAVTVSAVMLFTKQDAGATDPADSPSLHFSINGVNLTMRHINTLPKNSTYKLNNVGESYPASAGEYYLEFGEYPRSYVGNTLNKTLEAAYNSGTLSDGMETTGRTFTYNSANPTSTGSWNETGLWTEAQNIEYVYNGVKYVRTFPVIFGTTDNNPGNIHDSNVNTTKTDAIDQDGGLLDSSENTMLSPLLPSWFYVEPLRWIAANWANLPSGINPAGDGAAAQVELLSIDAVIANVPNGGANGVQWYNGGFRKFLNGGGYTSGETAGTIGAATIQTQKSFYGQAFTTAEQKIIMSTELDNVNDGMAGYTDTSDQNTNDKIFLLSYKQVFGGANDSYDGLWTQDTDAVDAKKCVVSTDYTYANYGWKADNVPFDLQPPPLIASGLPWLRSANSATQIIAIYPNGRKYENLTRYSSFSFRPALKITTDNLQYGIPAAAVADYSQGSVTGYEASINNGLAAADKLYNANGEASVKFDAGAGAVTETVQIGGRILRVRDTAPEQGVGWDGVYIGDTAGQKVYIQYQAWYEDNRRIVQIKLKARGWALYKSLTGYYRIIAVSRTP
jgi:hypothetical protein